MRLFIIFLLFVSAALAQRPVGPIRLADPNADRVMWWDDSEDRVDWMLPAEGRAWLDLEIGTDVQAYNAHLVDLADGLLPASKISIVDSGGYFDATTVEAALAEIILDGGAGGDSVSIDGVGVVDPNFQSTRDIAFFDDGGGDWSLYIRPNVIAYADFSVALQGTLTSDTEWDTAAEINAATTDADFLLDTAFIDDDTFATATASNIPSAESVKAYVDTEVAGASGTGDSVLVDGVNTVDPDFVSTGDVDFINNANTVTAEIKAGVIDLANLDAAIQASLALADTSLRPGDIGVTVQGYDADLADLADGTLSEGAIDTVITRDTEWDTAAEINAATTDNDFIIDTTDVIDDTHIDWASVTLADLTGAQIAPAISFNFGSAASFTLPAATLDGDLDAAGNNFTSVGDVTFQTGAAGGALRTGTSNADKFTLQAYDVDGGAYVTLIEADAGNDVRLQIPVDNLDLEDSADITKIAHFDASGITTGTTRTFAFPDASGTLTLSETLGTASTAALIDDDTFATATAANIPSAESVKAYVDANAGGDLATTDIDTFAELDAIVADKSLVNTTDTFDITVNNLDLAGSTAPVDTTEGRIQWDTDDDQLVVGTGAGTATFTPGGGSGDVTAAATFGTDNVVIRADGTSKGVQASGLSIDDSNNLSGIVNLTTSGNLLSGSAATPTGGFPTNVRGWFYADSANYNNIRIGAKEVSTYAGGALTFGWANTSDTWQSLWRIEGEITDTADSSTHVWSLNHRPTDTDRIVVTTTDVTIDGNKMVPETVTLALSDLTTSITAGTTVVGYWDAPYAITLTDAWATALTAPTGSGLVIDVLVGSPAATAGAASTIMSTDKLDISATEFQTGNLANGTATAPTLTTTAITAGQRLFFRFDSVGSTEGGKGIQATLEYTVN